MDLSRLFRSESLDSTASSPTSQPNPSHPRLHVDTTTTFPSLIPRKAASFRVDRTASLHAVLARSPTLTDPTPSPSPSPAPTPTHDHPVDIDVDAVTPRSTGSIHRRRSHSECLLLAKQGRDLPGPCQEYISSVKQILARSERDQNRHRHPNPTHTSVAVPQ